MRPGITLAVVGLLLGGGLVLFLSAGAPVPGSGQAGNSPITTVIQEQEVRDGPLAISGGIVVVAGTIDGDLVVYGGRILLTDQAAIRGDVQAYGGIVNLRGTVEGETIAYAGRVVLGGDLGTVNAGGLRVTIGGRTGSVTVLGGTIALCQDGRVAGDLEYDARLVDRGGRVEGARRPTTHLLGPLGSIIREARWIPVLAPVVAVTLGGALARHVEIDALIRSCLQDPNGTFLYGLGTVMTTILGLSGLVGTIVGLPLAAVLLSVCAAGSLVALALGQRAFGLSVAARSGISPQTGALIIAGVTAVLAFESVSGSLGLSTAVGLFGTGVVTRSLKQSGHGPPIWR